jgi:hypothetical protein
MARRMDTSRAKLDRLLSLENASVTLATLDLRCLCLGEKAKDRVGLGLQDSEVRIEGKEPRAYSGLFSGISLILPFPMGKVFHRLYGGLCQVRLV